ncbi:protein deadlock [Drosophila innubila]|uniref:protein deadlock n=1 Tax=Drosophila innubila TaxID=198719 RepID=UPI00148C0E55|nr:protein deadlock [Drosophila innubila]
MRQRDIRRMWATIVHHTGKDKYTNEEWQESFESFYQCMQLPTEPYIDIDKLVKIEKMPSDKQLKKNKINNSLDLKLKEDSNNSSDIIEDLQPLSALQKRIKFLVKSTESIPITQKSETNISEQKTSVSSERTIEIPTKRRRGRRPIKKIEQSECQPTKTEKEELGILQAQKEEQESKKKPELVLPKEEPSKEQSIQKQTTQATKRQVKKSADSQPLKSENDLSIQDQEKKRNGNQTGSKKRTLENQAFSQEPKRARLNPRSRSKRQSKLNPINGILMAHKSPTAINLIYEAPTSRSEEPVQSTEIAENLIVQNQESSRNDFKCITRDCSEIIEVEDKSSPIHEPILIHLSNEDNTEISPAGGTSETIEVDDNSTPIPMDESVFTDLKIDDYQDINQLLIENNNADLIIDSKENSDCDEIERYLQCCNAKTPSEIDDEIADTSIFDNIPNETVETTKMIKTPNEIDHTISDALTYADSIPNEKTQTAETTEIIKTPTKIVHDNIPNEGTETTEIIETPTKIGLEIPDNSNHFNNLSSGKEDTTVVLKTPSEIDNETIATNFFDNIPDLTTETTEIFKTPLELDAIIQDVLNYEFEDDALSVATSWDGEDLFPPDTKTDTDPNTKDTNKKDVQRISVKSEKTETEEPIQELNVQAVRHTASAKATFEELRRFRIPKKIDAKESSPQEQRHLNGYHEKQKEINLREQRPLNRCQKLNGQVQAKQAPQTVRQNIHSREQQMSSNSCNGSMPSKLSRVPIFAPPYRLPACEPSPSLPITPSAYSNDNNGMSEIFGIKCWRHFSQRCRKTVCNHSLADIGDVKRRLDLMNNSQLVCAYNFVLRHSALFKFCFSLFAEIFGRRSVQTKLVQMVEHCSLYMDLCVPFTTEIFYLMVRYKIPPEVAASHFMKHLWKPTNASMYPDLALQLLRILASADWYNYTTHLEELFSHKEFKTPIEFIVSIAQDAIAKNQPLLIDKLYELHSCNRRSSNNKKGNRKKIKSSWRKCNCS